MPRQPFRTILKRVRHIFQSAPHPGVTDAELLDRFVAGPDEAAFELLVFRHGPMVLSVCRRVLQDAHLAEDAFQATFLVLARKAGTIARPESLGGFLYTVAYRIALRARVRAADRARRETPLGDLPVTESGCDPADLLAWRELGPLLDDEVGRLPEKYRSAFVLCYLEGKTNEEAAEALGCPKGTVLSRLARARERLRRRLSGRGVLLSAAPFALMLAHNARALAEVSPALIQATVGTAGLIAAGKAASAVVSPGVYALMEDVLESLATRKQWGAAVFLTLLLLLLMGAGVYAYSTRPPAGFAPCHGSP